MNLLCNYTYYNRSITTQDGLNPFKHPEYYLPYSTCKLAGGTTQVLYPNQTMKQSTLFYLDLTASKSRSLPPSIEREIKIPCPYPPKAGNYLTLK